MASGPITSWQIHGETVEIVADSTFLGSKITADSDCSHEIKRRLLLGRKVMTNLDSILKSRDITLPTKVRLVSSVQFSRSVVSDSLWPHEPQHTRPPCPSPSPRVHSDSPPSSPWCHPAISPSVVPFSSCLQSFQHQCFSNEPALRIRRPKDWSFSFSVSLSNEYSRLISFRIDWFDLAVQGTLKSHLQQHSSKASILQCSAFFMVQLSHPSVPTGKTIALTIRTLVSKVMSLLSNMLFRFAIAFLPRSKRLLISFKPAFSLSFVPSSSGSSSEESSSSLFAVRVVSSAQE